ncbi:ArsR/SmtB family transcription factor [Streptomyces sp. NPDC091416]|uniref:ArsR/SmtB family transcription factor n=1 Tax=Streptomyces sp. NPDC091416 TaxID=3366003 RepID=UPI00380FF5D7
MVLGQDGVEGCCPGLLTAPLDEEQAADLAKVFKALGDPCACDLTPAFDLSQPTISHHLRLLRQAGLIAFERRGTWVYFRLLPQATDRLAAIFTRSAGQPLLTTTSAGAAS